MTITAALIRDAGPEPSQTEANFGRSKVFRRRPRWGIESSGDRVSDYCSHGLVQRVKLGVHTDESGVQFCGGCNKPVWESVDGPGRLAVPPALKRFLMVTMNDIPGYRITEVHGDVFGLVVRARNVFSNFGASLRTVVGGEVRGYTQLLTDSRIQARGRLAEEARKLGANAVVAMRFDCNEIGDVMSEIAAYGTAVTAEKLEHDPVGLKNVGPTR